MNYADHFQLAASGGYSALLPNPARTNPGIADGIQSLLVPIIAFII
jgi:hypothetical protein